MKTNEQKYKKLMLRHTQAQTTLLYGLLMVAKELPKNNSLGFLIHKLSEDTDKALSE